MDTRWRRGLITVIWKFPVGEWAATLLSRQEANYATSPLALR
jgi:hypothetical protein